MAALIILGSGLRTPGGAVGTTRGRSRRRQGSPPGPLPSSMSLRATGPFGSDVDAGGPFEASKRNRKPVANTPFEGHRPQRHNARAESEEQPIRPLSRRRHKISTGMMAPTADAAHGTAVPNCRCCGKKRANQSREEFVMDGIEQRREQRQVNQRSGMRDDRNGPGGCRDPKRAVAGKEHRKTA